MIRYVRPKCGRGFEPSGKTAQILDGRTGESARFSAGLAPLCLGGLPQVLAARRRSTKLSSNFNGSGWLFWGILPSSEVTPLGEQDILTQMPAPSSCFRSCVIREMVHGHCQKMREHSYQSGTWAQKRCAVLGVHPKICVQLASKAGLLKGFFSGFGELRPIESSGLADGLVGSNPISHPKLTRLRPAHMAHTPGPLAILHTR